MHPWHLNLLVISWERCRRLLRYPSLGVTVSTWNKIILTSDRIRHFKKKDWCVTRWPQTRMRFWITIFAWDITHTSALDWSQITRFTGVLAHLVNIHVYHINKRKVSCRVRITKTIFPHTIPSTHHHLQEFLCGKNIQSCLTYLSHWKYCFIWKSRLQK